MLQNFAYQTFSENMTQGGNYRLSVVIIEIFCIAFIAKQTARAFKETNKRAVCVLK